MSGHRRGPNQDRVLRIFPALQSGAWAHMLSNALSLVGALLRRRPEAAEDLLAYLADHLRHQVAPRLPLVSLADELRAVLVVIGIERARLGGRLRLEVACTPQSLVAQVPSLVLQPLVENAVRHGIARRPQGGRVRISARVTGKVLHLVVSDDGPGVRRPLVSCGRAGWGLVGVRMRLVALCGSSARLRLLGRDGAGAMAAISIPAVFLTP
ncbi:MAG: histidine kinase [bacterium]|nr:histidine kinase [bacterium]